MISFPSLLIHVVISPFKAQAQLEAEILLLRHQLVGREQRLIG